jgi:ABC-type transport system involved in Fe-S cluster assembly fused permease/ATPase subunit
MIYKVLNTKFYFRSLGQPQQRVSERCIEINIFIQADRKVTQHILKYLLMFAIQYNSIGLINTQYRCDESTQVTSCWNLLSPFRPLSPNSRSARMSFLKVQRVFIVRHHLASRVYLTCQNAFRNTFSHSSVPNKSTISRLVNRFRDTETLHRIASNMRKRVNACVAESGRHFQQLI